MSRPCKWCSSCEHTQFYCREKPRKPIPRVSYKRQQNPVEQKPRKPINKIGKKAKKWTLTSKEWKKVNPPDIDGYWYCRVGGYPLSDKSDSGVLRLNLCHNESRVRHPELAFELSNIFPGCQRHNKGQGSMNLEEYLSSDPSRECGDF